MSLTIERNSIMQHAFNENFYIVTATINPIFFLALTLQGTFYGRLVEKINVGVKAAVAANEKKRDTWKAVGTESVAAGAFLVAMIILMAGFVGEYFALGALYTQADDRGIEAFVFWSTAGLIFLTAAIPGWAAMRSYIKLGSTIMGGSRTLPVKSTNEATRIRQIKHQEDATTEKSAPPPKH